MAASFKDSTTTLSLMSDVDLMRNVLLCLSYFRFQKHWGRVGYLLKTICPIHALHLFQTWTDQSQTSLSIQEHSPNYIGPQDCAEFYDQDTYLKDEWVTPVSLLIYWIEIDQGQDHEIMNQLAIRFPRDYAILQCLSGSSYDVAKFLYLDFKETHVYVYKCGWYIYSHLNQIWTFQDKGPKWDLHFILNPYLDAYTQIYLNEVSEEGKVILKRTRQLRRLINMKSKLIKEAEYMFMRSEFTSLLDSQTHLIKFVNGTYDLNQHLFRPSQIDDYHSLCTGYAYETFVPEDPKIRYLNYYFDQMWSNPSERDSIWNQLIKSVLGQRSGKLEIWSDVEHCKALTNSRVLENFTEPIYHDLLMLWRFSLGHYATELSAFSLTQKHPPWSEIPHLRGKRLIVLKNTDKVKFEQLDPQVSIYLIKTQWIEGRQLFKGEEKFKPQFNIIYPDLNHQTTQNMLSVSDPLRLSYFKTLSASIPLSTDLTSAFMFLMLSKIKEKSATTIKNVFKTNFEFIFV